MCELDGEMWGPVVVEAGGGWEAGGREQQPRLVDSL